MKERPIIFNSEMIRAILKDRKTQTRRPIKLTDKGLYRCCPVKSCLNPNSKTDVEVMRVENPFGQVGNRLWVRETLHRHRILSKNKLRQNEDGIRYSADNREMLDNETIPLGWMWGEKKKTVASIHMPRWASRITLEITDIRVERVQKISRNDCFKEGIKPSSFAPNMTDPKSQFVALWNSIYKNWNDNPWVWVIEFKRII